MPCCCSEEKEEKVRNVRKCLKDNQEIIQESK